MPPKESFISDSSLWIRHTFLLCTYYILSIYECITETVFYCRNCLLCDNNVVKITDVAMGISLFNSDYSEVRGRSCAPIRWQPWETLLLVSLQLLYSLESVKLICAKVAFVHKKIFIWTQVKFGGVSGSTLILFVQLQYICCKRLQLL